MRHHEVHSDSLIENHQHKHTKHAIYLLGHDNEKEFAVAAKSQLPDALTFGTEDKTEQFGMPDIRIAREYQEKIRQERAAINQKTIEVLRKTVNALINQKIEEPVKQATETTNTETRPVTVGSNPSASEPTNCPVMRAWQWFKRNVLRLR